MKPYPHGEMPELYPRCLWSLSNPPGVRSFRGSSRDDNSGKFRQEKEQSSKLPHVANGVDDKLALPLGHMLEALTWHTPEYLWSRSHTATIDLSTHSCSAIFTQQVVEYVSTTEALVEQHGTTVTGGSNNGMVA